MPTLTITTIQQLRDWLETHHNDKEGVWLVFPKKTTKTDFSWGEIVDELLCYGWIDSVGKKVDETWTSLKITPRSPKSYWSRINKDKIAKLTEARLMHPNGSRLVEIAKQTGTWTALDDVENLVLPADLEVFLKDHNLLEKWHTKGRSFKRGFLEQLLNSKRLETRQKKMAGLVL